MQSLSIEFWDVGACEQVDWDCLLGATQLSSLQLHGPDLPPQIRACTALEQLAAFAIPQQLQALAGLRQLRDLQLEVEPCCPRTPPGCCWQACPSCSG